MNEIASTYSIRPAREDDMNVLFQLVEKFAESVNSSDSVIGNPDFLKEHLFGEHVFAEALIAHIDEKVVGYALFQHSYSSLSTQPGLTVNEIFVLPENRGKGIGKSLISYIANQAVARGYDNLNFRVSSGRNSIEHFLDHLGISLTSERQLFSLTGQSLIDLQHSD